MKAKQMNLYELRAIKQSIKEGIEEGLPWCDGEILAFYEKKEKELLHMIELELAEKGWNGKPELIEKVYNITK